MWARTGCADDDAAYLRELVAAAANLWRVDFGRIYAYGHSNGAAMAYRLACEASDLFAGVIAFAGVPPPADSAVGCAPSRPLRVLHIHATQDFTVPYAGALEATAAFTDYNGCRAPLPPGAAVAGATAGAERSLDLSERVIGKDGGLRGGGLRHRERGDAVEAALRKPQSQDDRPVPDAGDGMAAAVGPPCDPLDADCRVRRGATGAADAAAPSRRRRARTCTPPSTTYVIAIVLYRSSPSAPSASAAWPCSAGFGAAEIERSARPAAYTSSGRTVMPSRRRELYASSSALWC